MTALPLTRPVRSQPVDSAAPGRRGPATRSRPVSLATGAVAGPQGSPPDGVFVEPGKDPLRRGTVLSVESVPGSPGAHPAGPPPYYAWRRGASDPREELRRAHAVAGTMGAALIDVVAGRRGPSQILRWVSPEIREKVSVRRELETSPSVASSPAGPRRRFDEDAETFARPRRVRAVRVGPEEFEASVVVDCGSRCRALALRLRKTRGQWSVTAAEIG